jgi:hypothetical protein
LAKAADDFIDGILYREFVAKVGNNSHGLAAARFNFLYRLGNHCCGRKWVDVVDVVVNVEHGYITTCGSEGTSVVCSLAFSASRDEYSFTC